MRWRVLLEGFPGHPLHPPLTDATIGAFTVGTVAAVLAWAGVLVDVLAPTAPAALVIGLVLAVPTAVTGVADLLRLEPRTPPQTVALVHLSLMAVSSLGFLVAVLLLWPVVDGGEVTTPAAGVALASFVALAAGGWVGGALAYVHGVRVLGRPDTPPRRALRPGPHADD